MAGPHYFIGGTSGDFGLGANWNTGVVPATGENWGMNKLAQRSISAGLNQAAKTFPRVSIEEGCAFGIASAAGHLLCNIDHLYYAGRGLTACITGTILRATVDSQQTSDDALLLDALITALSVRRGNVRLMGTRILPAASRIQVGRLNALNAGETDAKLTIGSGVDLATNNTMVNQDGGQVFCSSQVDDLIMNGGDFYLGVTPAAGGTPDTGGLLLGEIKGGTFHWNSSGTVADFHASGEGVFINDLDVVKTLTQGSMYDEAVVDLTNANSVIFTNGIRALGRNAPLAPRGKVYSFA